jgi:hypothetical protein
MNMPRPLLIGLIVILAFTLGWVSYDELRRRETSIKQHSQMTEQVTPISTSATSEPLESPSETLPLEAARTPTPAPIFSSYPSTPASTAPATSTTEVLVNNQASQETPANTSETETTPAPETPPASEPTTEEEPPVCSSFDQPGLLATFDASLSAFIADATATYGTQYANLQYQLSSKTGTITGEQGTVTTGYSGTVQELSTGEGVSANGIITANFAWDGCVWQLVDYSF